MSELFIIRNIEKILKEIPEYVQLVAVIKGRNLEDINSCIKGGVKILGVNYVQEGEKIYPFFKDNVKFHFIGHLQSNKVKKAIKIFDMLQTIDSVKIVKEIQNSEVKENFKIPVLIEVNIGNEVTKYGIDPNKLFDFVLEISKFDKILIMGLMTMGPNLKDKNEIRKYFKKTRELYEQLKKMNLPNSDIKYLSMGMSDTYKIAIEEGANIIRIGRKIFEEKD